MSLPATWTKLLSADILQRSSQILSLAANHVYIFGGELRPREPRDNDMHRVSLTPNNSDGLTTLQTTTTPSPRVGSASTTLNNNIYLFSGRGGLAMTPLEDEPGTIWEFDPSSSTWTPIPPASPAAPYPPARSYHSMTSDGTDTLYIHAGCPASGRLSDLWSFTLSTRAWKELAPAPAPPRGGSSLAFAGGKVYRMNGFDGKSEVGGAVDVYSPEKDEWETREFAADGVSGPGPRSVGALVPVRIEGKLWLVTLFGECDPSALGHQGAGKMLDDVWAFSVEEGVWKKVVVGGEEEKPCARGWFAADGDGERTIVVQGGLDENNQRLGDVWMLSF